MDNEEHCLPKVLRKRGCYQNGDSHFCKIKCCDYLVDGQNDHQPKSVRYDWVVSGYFVHLGQEFTPHWVAQDIVEYNMDLLDGTTPRIVDMCCGSGVFLIESIKAVRERYDIVPERYSMEKDDIAFSCVIGFDIDPLAVMLAKVNWVMSMRDLFLAHHGDITVPIYHADSLFVATPITHQMPYATNDAYILHFDHHEVSLPSFLLSPEYRKTFDAFMAKVYRLAMV